MRKGLFLARHGPVLAGTWRASSAIWVFCEFDTLFVSTVRNFSAELYFVFVYILVPVCNFLNFGMFHYSFVGWYYRYW